MTVLNSSFQVRRAAAAILSKSQPNGLPSSTRLRRALATLTKEMPVLMVIFSFFLVENSAKTPVKALSFRLFSMEKIVCLSRQAVP